VIHVTPEVNVLQVERHRGAIYDFEKWGIIGNVPERIADVCRVNKFNQSAMSDKSLWSLIKFANESGIDVVIHGMRHDK
jgi:hypothetical protein